jgi:hypothetical protein
MICLDDPKQQLERFLETVCGDMNWELVASISGRV